MTQKIEIADKGMSQKSFQVGNRTHELTKPVSLPH